MSTSDSQTDRPPRRSRIVQNVLANWGAYVFAVVLNFFLAPFIVHRLGDSAYGAWVLLAGLVGYLGLLDLGVRGAVTRYMARLHAEDRHDEAGRMAAAALSIFTAAGLLAVLVSVVLALNVGHLFRIPAEFVASARLVVVLGGLSIAVSLVAGAFGGIVIGLQRFDVANSIDVTGDILRAGLIVLALANGHGLVALAAIQLLIAFLRGAANLIASSRLYPELRLLRLDWDRTQLRTIFSFSFYSTLLQASGMLIQYSDAVIIGAFLPVSLVTFFSIGMSLTQYARAAVTGISQAFTPFVSSLQGAGREADVRRVLERGSSLASIVALPIVITFLTRGTSFIDLWMGPEYGGLSGHVLSILALSLWAGSSFQVTTATMLGMGRHRGLVPVFICEAVCNLALCVALIGPMGIVGVAWGTTIPRLVVSLFLGPWYARRTLGIPLRAFWTAAFLLPSLAMVPFALASYLIEAFWPASSLLVYFAQVAAALPVAALGAWLVCLTPDERRSYAALAARPLRTAFGRT